MIDKVLTGIFTKFTGSALSTALGGRMYSRFAPQGTAFPYAVVDVPTSVHGGMFVEDIEDLDVLFNLFSQSKSETEITGLLNNLITLYDDCTLTVTGYTHLFMERDITRSLSDPEYGIRQYSVIYNCSILK